MYAVCDNMIDIRRASFPISNLPSSSSSFTSSNHIFCTMQFTFIQLLVTTSSDITFFTRIKSGATAAVSRMNETKKHLAILNKRTRHKYMYILNIFLFLLSVNPSVGKNKKKQNKHQTHFQNIEYALQKWMFMFFLSPAKDIKLLVKWSANV